MLADERFSLPLLRVRITLPPEGLHGNFVSLAVIASRQRQRRSGQHFVPDLDQHIVAVEADIPGQRAIGLLDQQIGAFGGKTHRRGIGFPFGNADLHDRAAPHRIDRVALFHFEMQPQSPFLFFSETVVNAHAARHTHRPANSGGHAVDKRGIGLLIDRA